jgi:hypothetical protein
VVEEDGWEVAAPRHDGRYVLRLAIGQQSTTLEDVRLAWDVLRETLQTVTHA